MTTTVHSSDLDYAKGTCDHFDEMATLLEQRGRTWDDAVKARHYQQTAARLRAEVREIRFGLSKGRRVYRIDRRLRKLRKWMTAELEKHALLTDEDRADEALAMEELRAESG